MNAKHFGMLIVASLGGLAMTGIGCGDSSSTGGAGGTGSTTTTSGTGSTTSGTTTSSSKSGSGTGTTTGTGTATSSTGTGGDCTTNCETAHPSGYMVLEGQVIQACGCAQTGPCKTQCTGNAACMTPPGAPTGDCQTCLSAEAAKGPASTCALGAATGTTCQADADCKALVTCILGCAGG